MILMDRINEQNMAQQTAVEWLVEKLKSQGLLIGEPNNLIAVSQAKEMEKQQIVDDFKSGNHTEMRGGKFIGDISEQYDTETFGE
jgi:hypothetical protein